MKKRDAKLWLVSLVVGSAIILPIWWTGVNMIPGDLVRLQLDTRSLLYDYNLSSGARLFGRTVVFIGAIFILASTVFWILNWLTNSKENVAQSAPPPSPQPVDITHEPEPIPVHAPPILEEYLPNEVKEIHKLLSKIGQPKPTLVIDQVEIQKFLKDQKTDPPERL